MTLAIATVVVLVLAGVVLLALGLHNGDQDTDVRVTAAMTTRAGRPHAVVTAANPGTGIALVSATAGPAPMLLALLGFSDARSTALLHPRTLRGLELLGGVAPDGTATWLLPLDLPSAVLIRIRVRVEQPGRRTRLVTLLRPAPMIDGGETRPAPVRAGTPIR